MPELPEVETVVRGLRPLLEGRRLGRVEARRADLRWPLPGGFAARLSGRRVETLARRAKFGLVRLDGGETLIFHLGMSGRFRLLDGPAGPHDHLLFTLGDGRVLAYCDPRRFGAMDLVASGAEAAHRWLKPLGPEPFSPGLGAVLAAAARPRGRPSAVAVKALVMDQRVVAGVGNIYASEALFAAGIDPRRAAGRIAGARLDRLAQALTATLKRAIRAGGTTLRDHAGVTGEEGRFQHEFLVYGRAGAPCPRCGRALRRIVLNGRSTYLCVACQR